MARRTIALLVQAAAAPIINEDDKAAEAITPGDLVTFNGAGNLIRHNVAGGNAVPTFALEREEMGADIDDNYAVDDVVKVGIFRTGARVNARVAAAAAAIVKGDLLESAGDGTLRKATKTDVNEGGAVASVPLNKLVARAIESVDNSGGGAAVRIRAEVL